MSGGNDDTSPIHHCGSWWGQRPATVVPIGTVLCCSASADSFLCMEKHDSSPLIHILLRHLRERDKLFISVASSLLSCRCPSWQIRMNKDNKVIRWHVFNRFTWIRSWWRHAGLSISLTWLIKCVGFFYWLYKYCKTASQKKNILGLMFTSCQESASGWTWFSPGNDLLIELDLWPDTVVMS